MGFSDRVDQLRRKGDVLARTFENLAHIDQLGRCQAASADAVGQAEICVFAGLGVVKRFHRRRCRAENDDRSGKMRTHHGDIAGVVKRRFVLAI